MKNSKIFLVSVLTAATLVFTGCNEQEAEDGKIPAEYVQNVHSYLGTYSGKIHGVDTLITISMNDNVPFLTVQNKSGNDITGSNCQSQVGELLTYKVKEIAKKQYTLERVTFDLDRGVCMIDGTIAVLDVKSTSEFELKIVEKDTRSTVCPPTAQGASLVDPRCDEVGTIAYIRAKFKK